MGVYDFTLTVGADDSAANQVLDLLNKNLIKATKKDNVISITADATNVEKALKELAEVNPTVGASIEIVVDQSKVNKEIDFLNGILNSKTQIDGSKVANKFKKTFTSGIKDLKLGDILQNEVGDKTRSIENVQTAVNEIAKRISGIDITDSLDIQQMTSYVEDLETANVLLKEISKNKKLGKVDTSALNNMLGSLNMDDVYSQIGQNIFMNQEEILGKLQKDSLELITSFQKRLSDILKYGAGYEIVSSEEYEKEKKKLFEMEQIISLTQKSTTELMKDMYGVGKSIEDALDENDIKKAKELQRQLWLLGNAYKQVTGKDASKYKGSKPAIISVQDWLRDAKAEFGDFGIEIISEESVQKQKERISALEKKMAEARAGASARVGVEPDIDPAEFARMVSDQLSVPAQIEVEGEVSNPQEFADNIAKQLTVPVDVDVTSGNNTSTGTNSSPPLSLENLRRENQIRDESNVILKNFNSSLKDTAAYLYDVNNQEERMIMLQGKAQVGNTIVQNNGHVGVSYDLIDSLKPDTLAHSHQFDKVFNNLRFSTDDLAKATARDFINRLVLSCGDQMLELDFSHIDPQSRELMVQDMTETYASVFALYGANIKEDGTIGNPKESLAPEMYNKAVDVINSMMYEIAQKYYADFSRYNASDFGDEYKNIPFKPVSNTVAKYISAMNLALRGNNQTGIEKLRKDFAEDITKATKNVSAEVDVDPDVDSKTFADKLNSQLTVPAQIEVTGVVSDPKSFADDISKQLTVPVNVDVKPTENASSSTDTNAGNEPGIDPKLNDRINQYQRAIKNLQEYVELQKEIKKANPSILPGFHGMERSSYIYGGELHRNGTPFKKAIKYYLNEYLNNNTPLKFDRLAAYVNALQDTETAEEIFGKRHADLFKQVMAYIEQAKLSLDAYNKAQIALSAGQWNLQDAGFESGFTGKFETILKNDGVETAIEYLKKEFGFEIPQAVEATTSAISDSAKETAKQTQTAENTIKGEGKAAKEAAKWKKEFAKANKDVAQASEETAEKAEAAAESVKAEGDAAQKATDSNKSFKENADLLKYLKEIQSGTGTIHFGVAIDKEMADAELKKIAPMLADDFNKKYGTSLTAGQVVKAYKAALKEQQAADEAALQSHLESMEKRTQVDEAYEAALQEQVRKWAEYSKQAAEDRQLKVLDDAMHYAEQQAADELEYRQKSAMYREQGSAQIQQIIEEEKEQGKAYQKQHDLLKQIYDLKEKNLSLSVQESKEARTTIEQNERAISDLQKRYDENEKALSKYFKGSNYQKEAERNLADYIDRRTKELSNAEERVISHNQDIDDAKKAKATADTEKARRAELNKSYEHSREILEEINRLRIDNIALDENDLVEQNKLVENREQILKLYQDLYREADARSANQTNTSALEEELQLYRQELNARLQNAKAEQVLKQEQAEATQRNKEVAKAYDNLYKSAKEYYSLLLKSATGLTSSETSRLESLEKEWSEATAGVWKYQIEMDGTTDSINRATAAQEKFMQESQNASATGIYKNLQSSYEKIQRMIGSGKYTSAFVVELAEIQRQIREMANTPLDLDDAALRQKLVKLQSNIDETIGKKAFSDVRKAASSSLSKLELQINQFTNQNTGMGLRFKQQFENLRIRLTDAKSIADVEKLSGQIVKLKSEVEAAGKATRSFFDVLKERIVGLNAQALAQYFSWQDWIRYIRQMATTVTELDTALTEMRKVSDDSLTSLQAYQKTTFDTANAVGTTALALQKSTADWMRLGEAQQAAAESAKASTVLMNVSEFESIDEATQALVSVSQAYQDIDKMDIIDVINNIGNNYSVATDELAQGLQNAAAVLKTQGNDLNEAVALLTAGNAITQDISKTSAGIRTISLRIAGTEEAKDQLAELGEEVDDFIVQTQSKTQKLIKDYTSVASNAYQGVDVLDANGNLRNTYDILLDIAKIYKEIQEEDVKAGTNRAQALVEYIAGKNRSNIAASILLNPDMLENVYNSALDSTGSAERELSKYLESIEGHIARLQTQLQELEFDALDSGVIKTFIDLGTGALSVIDSLIDSLGLLGTLGTAAAIAAATQNFGLFKIKLDETSESGLRVTTIFNDLADALGDAKQFSFSESYVQGITDAKNAFEAYTADVEAGIDPQDAFNHILATGNEALMEYATQYGVSTEAQNTFLNGQAKAQISLMAENTSLTNVSSLIQGYNNSLEATGLSQQEFASAVMATNGSLGQYLIKLGNAEATMGGYLAYVVKTTASTVALRAVTMALNAVIGMAVSWLISKAIQAWDDYIHRVDNAKKALQEFEDMCSSLQSDLDKQRKAIDNLSDSYFELAKGVDTATGKNISLSSEDYESFMKTNQELADVFPELVTYVDEYGHRFVDLGDNAEYARKKLEDFYNQEEEQYQYQLYKNLPETFRNEKIVMGDIQKQFDDIAAKRDGINASIEQLQKLSVDFASGDMVKIATEYADEEGKAYATAFWNAYAKAINDASDPSQRQRLQDALLDYSTGDTLSFAINLTALDEDDRKYLQNSFKEFRDEYSKELDATARTIESELTAKRKEYESQWQSILPSLIGSAQYLTNDEETSALAAAFIGNLSSDIYDEIKDKPIDAVIREWIGDISSLSIEDRLKLEDILNPQLSPQERINLYNELKNSLPQEGFNLPIHFVIDDDQELLSRVHESQRQLASYTNQFGVGEVDPQLRRQINDFFDEMKIDTEEEYEAWLRLSDELGNAYLVMKAYREEVSKTAGETAKLFSVSKFTEQKEKLEEVKTLYESFRNNVENGELKVPLDISDVEGLSEEWKSLEEFKDFEFTVTTSTDISEVQKAFDGIATAYGREMLEIEGLTKETMDMVKAQLELDGLETEGVDTLVDSLAAEEKMKAFVNALEQGNDAQGHFQDEAISSAAAIYKEGQELGLTDQMLSNYIKQAWAASGIKLDGDDAWLDQLAQKLQIDINLLKELLNLSHQGSGYVTDSSGNIHSTYGGAAAEGWIDKQHKWRNDEQYRNNTWDYSKFKSDASKGSGGAGKAGKEDGDAYVEAFEKELEKLKNAYERGEITHTEYLERWKALVEKYFKDNDKYAEEYANRMKEYWDEAISHMESVVSAIGTLLDKKISAAEKGKDAAIKALEQEKEAAAKYYQEQIDYIDDLIDELNDEKDAIQDQIDSLREANEERERAINLQKAQYELQKAQNQRTKLIYKDGQMVYENDTTAIRDSKKAVEDAEFEITIASLEKEISLIEKQIEAYEDQKEALQKMLDASNEYYDNLIAQTEEYWDALIESLQNQKSKWQELVEQKEIAEAFALVQDAMEKFGFTVEDVLNDTPGAFEAFRDAYLKALTDANSKNQDFLDGLNYATDGASKALTSISDNASGAADSLSAVGDVTEKVSDAANALEKVATHSGTAATNASNFASSLSEISETASGAAQGLEDTATNIAKEGEAAGNAAPQKEAFANANQRIAENAVTVSTNVAAAAEAIGLEGTNASNAYQSLDNLSKVELTPLATQTSELAGAIGEVAQALGVGEDATVSSLETAITNLSTMSLGDEQTGVIGSFNALKDAVSGVTTAIGGAAEGEENAEANGASTANGSDESAGASTLTSAIEAVKTATDTNIGVADDDESGATAISDFNMLKKAVELVCQKIGMADEGGEAAEDSLLGIIQALPDIAEPALVGDGGLKAMFEELLEAITACAYKAAELASTIESMGSAGGVFGQVPAIAATGNVHIGNAYASGKLGIKHPGESLVGEAGQELIVDSSTGKYRLTNGPEITKLDKGDLVFNAAQTKSIIKHGMTDSGRSYAEGTGTLLPLTSDEQNLFKTMGNALMGIKADTSSIVEPVKAMAQKVTNNTTNIAPIINVTGTQFTVQGVTGEAVTRQIQDTFSGIIANAYQRAMK